MKLAYSIGSDPGKWECFLTKLSHNADTALKQTPYTLSMILSDLHIHSTFSDGKMAIPEIVDHYGSRGFQCIAITDHVSESTTAIGVIAQNLQLSLSPALFPIYREILRTEAARAWDQYRMIVIPGLELSKNSISNHRSAHILALGVTDYISADGDVTDMISRIHAQGALAIAAHPVSTRKWEKQTFHLWNRRQELATLFDAWEVASGPFLFDEVKASGLPMLASSDLHSLKQMTSWKTVFECELHRDAIFQAIRRQKLSFLYYQDKETKRAHHTRPNLLEPRFRVHPSWDPGFGVAV